MYPDKQVIEALVTDPSVVIVMFPPVGIVNEAHFSIKSKIIHF